MEDISRELEKELIRAKPTPYKSSRKAKVVVIDDFGELKSGGYLRILVYFFSVTTLVLGSAAVGLFLYYGNQSKALRLLTGKVTKLEQQNQKLTREKDIYMAKLVMSGKKEAIQAIIEKEKKAVMPKAGKETANAESKPATTSDSDDSASSQKADSPSHSATAHTDSSDGPQVDEADNSPVVLDRRAVTAQEAFEQNNSPISIDKFFMSENSETGEFEVGFDIKNVKQGPGEVSGRVFIVLMPEKGGQSNWVVLPKTPLTNGIPSLYQKGQYFSISRFKPVKFTINDSDREKPFKKAAVYIFNDNGELIFKDFLDMAQGEEVSG